MPRRLPLPFLFPFLLLLAASPAVAQVGFKGPPATMDRIIYLGESLRWQAALSGGYPWTFSLSTAPSGTAVDSQKGLVSWKPSRRQFGKHLVVLQAKGLAGSVRVSFDLRVEAPPYRFRSIDPPGSMFTTVHGINNKGVMVGYGASTAFRYDGSSFVVIKPPVSGGSSTIATDINDKGVICGSYRLSFTGKYYGFTYDNGTYTTTGGGAYMTMPEGINNAGDLNGWANLRTGMALLRPLLVFGVSIWPPGITVATKAQVRGFGLNDKGQAVADYYQFVTVGSPQNLPRRGWLYERASGSYSVLAVPDGVGTAAVDITDGGVVVGWYNDPVMVDIFRGFIVRPPYGPDDYRPVRIAGAVDVFVRGTNNLGQIVGGYTTTTSSNKRWHGFVLDPIPWCQPDLGQGSPGGPVFSLCGQPLLTGSQADLRLVGAPSNSPAVLLLSLNQGKFPFAGGYLVPAAPQLPFFFLTSAQGTVSLPDLRGGGGLDLFVQSACMDRSGPPLFSLSNAIWVELLR